MAGDKPRYKVTIKSKQTDNKANIAAFWVRDNGMIGGTLDQDVDFIQLKNGAKIRNDNAWLNMFDNGEQNQPKPEQVETDQRPIADDDVPF